MNIDCGYDSASSSIYSSDCLSLCFQLGCSEDLLDNESCDPECDIQECGFDQGECGYCSSGCFKSDILNSAQDPQCNNIHCYYDSSIYKECSPGCTNQKLMNSECDSECNTSLCNFDYGKCLGISTECSEGCLSSYLGNGICNEECNNETCTFDDYDCLCAPECTPDLLTNGVCDEVCSKGTCQDDCTCDSKCEDSYGDGVCDEDCWNELCEWIDQDCGCSKDCKFDEIVSCKKECLGINCNFGDMGENKKCEDDLKLELARAYQIVHADFDVSTSIEDCENASWNLFKEACTEEMLRNDPCFTLDSGEQPCNIEECGYAFGQCNLSCDCGEGSRCFEENSSKCLSCSDKNQFFSLCVEECPQGFNADSSNLCMPGEDTSSQESPKEYYVKNGMTDYGDGSEESPFSSISIALASIHSKFSILYLEEDEHYTLSSVPSDFIFIGLDWKRPLSRPYFKPENLTIQGSNSFLEIKSQDFLILDAFWGTLEIRSITFSAPNLSSLCEEDCDYCDEDCIENCIPDCSEFDSYDFMHISSSLVLSDIIFKNMRNNFNNMIYIQNGVAELRNVEFEKVKVKSSYFSAIIKAQGAEKIDYVNGKVSFLNDGFKIDLINYYRFNSFMITENVNYVMLENIDFEFNVVHQSYFFYMIDSNHLDINSCGFYNNMLNSGIVYFEDLSSSSFTLMKDSNNTIYELSYEHIRIRNTVVKNNFFYNRSLMRYRTIYKNFLFENIEVEHIFLEDGEGLDIEDQLNPSSGYRKIYINGVRKLGYYTESSVAIVNVTYKDWIIYEDNPILIENLGEIYIESLTIQNITSDQIDIYEFFLNDFLENVSSTYKPQELDEPEPIPSVIGIKEVRKISIINSNISNLALSESYLIEIETASELTIDKTSMENIEIALSSAIINILDVKESQVTNSFFTSCKNTSLLGGGLFLFSKTSQEKATFENCTMINNAGTYGGSIVSSQDQLFINNCTFEDNESFSMNGGAVLFVTNNNPDPSFFSLTNSTFIGNLATLADGGAIYIAQEESENVEINIDMCEFKGNYAKNKGSAIGIDNGLTLTSNSAIKSCGFYNNLAENGAVAVSSDGYLLIHSCEFDSNNGESTAGIYHEGAETLDLHVELSCFMNNKGFSTIYVNLYSVFNKMTSNKCKFENNYGKPVVIQYANWTDFNSEFNHNTDESEEGTGSEITYFSISSLEGTKFYDNKANNGPGLTVTMRSQVTCNNCIFDRNLAFHSAGAVNVKQSAIHIHNSLITRNTCTSGLASAFKVADSGDIQSSITNTEISHNQAGLLGYTVIEIMSVLLLKGVIYHDNTADNEETGILLNMGTLYLEDSECYNQVALNAPCILGSMGELHVLNSTFHNNLSSKVSGAISLMKVTAEVKDSHFYDIQTYDGGVINVSSDSHVTVDSCRFSQITTDLYGVVTGKDSALHIKNSLLSHYIGNGAYCQGCASFKVENSDFSYGSADFGAGLNIKASSAEISNSSFSYLAVSGKGGAVSSDSDDIKDLVIADSNFLNNTSHGGGAIYTLNNFLNISNSHFEANGAYTRDSNKGNGGGALLECSIECRHYIQNNVFIRNEASYEGGAVHWKDENPHFESNMFQDNSALYGNDIASFPIEIIEINTNRRRLEEQYPTIAYKEDVAPGQYVEEVMTLALRDHYGQIIETDNESRVTLSSVDPEVQVTGTTFFIASSGRFNISDYMIQGTPNSTVNILLATTAIDKSKAEGEEVFPEVFLRAELRGCVAGEVNIRNSCVKCGPYFYSLDPSDQECLDCPEGAVCEGENIMYPEAKYWRTSENSDHFWLCPNPDACLGGNSTSLMGECAEGYKGNKCQSCDISYSRSFANKCASCPDKEWEIVKLTTIVIIVTLVAVLIIRSSLTAAIRPKSMLSVYFKIFLNYIQLVMMTSTFELDWPEYAIEVLTFQKRTGSATEILFSFECFLSDKPSSDVYFLKVIFFAVLPFGLILISLVFWGIAAIFRSNLKYFTQEMIATNIILIFIIHSNIMKSMFAVLNCTEIDQGEQWLDVDLDIRCWDREHAFYAFAVALPSIIIWGLFVPSFVLYTLYRNKRHMGKLNVRKKYGFLFNGFTSKTYYWEIVILYRKIMILFCAVALKNISVPVQALCVLIVLLVSIFIQKKYNPYSYQKLNQIELKSIFVGACTIYCGLFFITGDLNAVSKVMLFVFMILMNLYFLALWFHGICKIGIRAVAQKIPRLMKYAPKPSNNEYQSKSNESHSRIFADKTFKLRAEHVRSRTMIMIESESNTTMKDLFLEVLNNDLVDDDASPPDAYSFSHSVDYEYNDNEDIY